MMLDIEVNQAFLAEFECELNDFITCDDIDLKQLSCFHPDAIYAHYIELVLLLLNFSKYHLCNHAPSLRIVVKLLNEY